VTLAFFHFVSFCVFSWIVSYAGEKQVHEITLKYTKNGSHYEGSGEFLDAEFEH